MLLSELFEFCSFGECEDSVEVVVVELEDVDGSDTGTDFAQSGVRDTFCQMGLSKDLSHIQFHLYPVSILLTFLVVHDSFAFQDEVK